MEKKKINVALFCPVDHDGNVRRNMFYELLNKGVNKFSTSEKFDLKSVESNLDNFKPNEDECEFFIEEFNVTKEEYPHDISQFNAVIIAGSPANSYDNDPWIRKLMGKINLILSDPDLQDVRILGICFGHQISSRAIGCHVRKNPKGSNKGSRSFPLSDDARVIIQNLSGKLLTNLNTIYTHRDEVYSLPSGDNDITETYGIINLSSEAHTPFPGFIVRNKRSLRVKMLTFQGHPEYLTTTGSSKIFAMADSMGKVDSVMATKFLESCERVTLDEAESFAKIIRNFIKG